MWVRQPRMNNKMSALLQRAGLRWPLVACAIPAQLPTLEILEDCVLLKEHWEPNKHVKITDCFDRTGFECFVNHVHLPFAGTNESLVSCLKHAATLQEHWAATRPPALQLLEWLALEHRDAVNVDRVPFNVSGHGNVMSIVLLEGVGIVHRQDLLVLVGNDDWLGAGCDALFRACLRARVGSLNATLRVANPAVHGLGIAGK